MPQWGNTDASSNAVKWAAQTLGLGSGPTNEAANNTALYGNTTANAFKPNITLGLFGVDSAEVSATPGAHAGWVLKRTGSGGRAGRVQYETLVAMNGMTSDGDGTTIPNVTVTFTSQPANATANSTNHETATFTATATYLPLNATVTFQWQANSGAGFANVANGAVYNNVGTTSLFVSNTTGLTACFLCDLGMVQPFIGSVNCSGCSPGTYIDSPGQDVCLLCPPGTASNKTGSIVCDACFPGNYQEC